MAVRDPKTHLKEQLDFLSLLCDAYDAGGTSTALGMSVAIRVLMHNTDHSTSLLKHLGATGITLLTQCREIQLEGCLRSQGFLIERYPIGGAAGTTACFLPKLGWGSFKGEMIGIEDWWNQVVFLLDPETILTREKIVLGKANKDGGAHVDDKLELERDYEALVSGGLGEWVTSQGTHECVSPMADPHIPALRQMAYELLHSPDLLSLAE